MKEQLPSRWVDLTFGLTEGWWRFADVALRPSYALITKEQWLGLLKESGLEGVAFGPSETGNVPGNQQTILLGRKPLTNMSKTLPEIRGHWVILADAHGISQELGTLIAAAGLPRVFVRRGSEYDFSDGKHASLDPSRAEHFTRFFSDLRAGGLGPLCGIVSLWAVDEELTQRTTPAQWEAAQARLGAGILQVFQAFCSDSSIGARGEARFWIATRGAQAVSCGDESTAPCQPIQALAWGLSRVMSLEHPSRFGAVIDLDPEASSKESAEAFWREIVGPAEEDAVAFRHRHRLVPRLAPLPEPPAEPFALQRDASYLITGGLGGLGLLAARWMAERGAGHLVLLSRRDFPARSVWPQLPSESRDHEAVQSIIALEKLGARVTVARGDVADEHAMRSLLGGFGNTFPTLRGILHAAVEMSGSLINRLDPETFNQMCRAKALGGWVLHQLTLDLKLDFFVYFSSSTAVWGVAGLGHYAAANQALDLLAHWRRAKGLPALSVNWGTWQEMRVASQTEKVRFERAGLHPMPAERAFGALERLIGSRQTSAIVASVDWNVLRTVYEARRLRPLFAQMRGRLRMETEATPTGKPDGAESDVRRQLRQASPNRRRDIVISHLRAQAGSVLGFNPSREIELDQGLFDRGMDSLMSVELKGRLERSFGVPLPSTLTFNYPTIGALANYLLDEVLKEDVSPAPEKSSPPSVVSPLAQGTEDLSEHEISLLLMKKLEQMK